MIQNECQNHLYDIMTGLGKDHDEFSPFSSGCIDVHSY